MKTIIVDYGAGNLKSVERAVSRLGFECEVTSEAERVASAERVIFPGVGAAGAVMDAMRERGLDRAIRDRVGQGVPVLFICIGIQIILERSEENDAECLGLLPGAVQRFPDDTALKVPQIGWNQAYQTRPHPFFEGVPDGADFYFVNSYHPVPAEDSVVIGRTTYGVEFSSVVAYGSLIATQFHPEKSGPVGLRMLENFLGWCP